YRRARTRAGTDHVVGALAGVRRARQTETLAHMREKLLVCISALQATAAHWRAGKILSLQQFANNDAGLAAFREFLTPHTNVPVYMTVDAVEEDYRFEMLPHSFGTDRGQMVARKLRQH